VRENSPANERKTAGSRKKRATVCGRHDGLRFHGQRNGTRVAAARPAFRCGEHKDVLLCHLPRRCAVGALDGHSLVRILGQHPAPTKASGTRGWRFYSKIELVGRPTSR